MADFSDVIRDVMFARFRTQTPEHQMVQTLVAQEVNSTKSSAQQEIVRVEEAWEKRTASMTARGVAPTDLEWINAYRVYQEDLASARKWANSIQAAGERMLDKVGR